MFVPYAQCATRGGFARFEKPGALHEVLFDNLVEGPVPLKVLATST